MFKKFVALVLLIPVVACTPRIGGTDVEVSQAGKISSVSYGTIMSVTKVLVNDDNSGGTMLGTVGGAAAGGVLGNQIGGGSGKTIATVGGAILGALAGSEMTKAAKEQEGYQLVIKLDSGQDAAIVQGADIQFYKGQRVQIIYSSGKARVLPFN